MRLMLFLAKTTVTQQTITTTTTTISGTATIERMLKLVPRAPIVHREREMKTVSKRMRKRKRTVASYSPSLGQIMKKG